MLANLDRLGRRMDELGLDGLIATTFENVHYLTGIASQPLVTHPHSGKSCALVTRDRLAHPYFVSGGCEIDQHLDATVPLGGVVRYGQFFREPSDGVPLTPREEALRRITDAPHPGDALGAVVNTLRDSGLASGRVGIDENGVRFGFLDELRDALPGLDLRPAADVFRWTRKVKTPAELPRVAASAAVIEQAIQAAISVARPGATEQDLVREFERTVAGLGGRPKFTLIKFGRAAIAGQTRPGTEPLRRGDSIWFDVGCVLDGYWSDLARVYSFGEPSPKLSRYYAAMLAGCDRAFELARPGLTGKELFDITVDGVRTAGVPHYRRHHVGHGIGVEVYEPVLITPTNTDVIEEGTVVNIETPYYEYGFGAVHVEDPFVVGATENRWLTTLDRNLVVFD